MIKILKHGKSKLTHNCICFNCGCTFICDEADTEIDIYSTCAKIVVCPDCGHKVLVTGGTYTYIDNTTPDYSPCDNCPNAAKNGGSGICHCVLGAPKITC